MRMIEKYIIYDFSYEHERIKLLHCDFIFAIIKKPSHPSLACLNTYIITELNASLLM